MAANTTIEWATKSWNPVRGCSRVSPGCDECYAMKFAHRFAGVGKPYEGLTTIRKGKVDWSGVARFIPSELDAPLRWKKPERIFVNSMSDLFHSSITFEQVAAVFGVMAAAPWHQFLVLTKRPERALEFFNWTDSAVTWDEDDPQFSPLGSSGRVWNALLNSGDWGEDGTRLNRLICELPTEWPLPNVWLGVSCENQETADERIPLLLKCPAAVRWVSAEPLLGALDLFAFFKTELRDRCLDILELRPVNTPGLDWVVVGGESGPGAREFDVDWARDIARDCKAAGVACFVKQLGSKPLEGEADREEVRLPFRLKSRKGGDISEWPEDLRVREFPTPREA